MHVSSNLYNSCPDIYPKQSLNHLHQPNLFFFSPNICSLKSLLWHKLVSLPPNSKPLTLPISFPLFCSHCDDVQPNTPGNAVFLRAHLVILSLSLLSKINFLHSQASTTTGISLRNSFVCMLFPPRRLPPPPLPHHELLKSWNLLLLILVSPEPGISQNAQEVFA